GVGGDRIGDLRARWQADAIDPAPSVLTVYVGVNDTWRRFDAGMPTSASEFEHAYRGMLEEARAAVHQRFVLVDAFRVPGTTGPRRSRPTGCTRRPWEPSSSPRRGRRRRARPARRLPQVERRGLSRRQTNEARQAKSGVVDGVGTRAAGRSRTGGRSAERRG